MLDRTPMGPTHAMRETPSGCGNGSAARRTGVLLMAAMFLSLPGPSVDAGHPTWETPHTGDGARLWGLAAAPGGPLWAVGQHGSIITGTGGDWGAVAAPTDRHLHAVAFTAPDRGVAVGERGVVLDYGPHWGDAGDLPEGVLAVEGRTGEGATAERRVEFRLPLSVLEVGPGSRFGFAVTARGTAEAQHHPAAFDPARPGTAEGVRFDDVMQGTPVVDGEREALWAPAVHAEHLTGPVPFSVHLLRDSVALYVLVAGRSSLEEVSLQTHRVHGPLLEIGDDRFVHPLGAAATHTAVGPPDWRVEMPPDVLTSSDLRAVAWFDPLTPIAVGADGVAFVREEGLWRALSTGTSRDLNGVDAREGAAVFVGAAPNGQTGAVLLRTDGTDVRSVPLPPGEYGLHAVDLTTCHAAGSGSILLHCQDGDLTQWAQVGGAPEATFFAITHDDDTQTTWLAGATDAGTAALYEDPGTGWRSHSLPTLEGPLHGIHAAAWALSAITLDGDILRLVRHPPLFVTMPTSVEAVQGLPVHIGITAEDQDDDFLYIDLHPRPGIPFPRDLKVDDRGVGDWDISWIPSFDAPPLVGFEVHLSDGEATTVGAVDVHVEDANGPPYWDPHPDATIPHSIGWTTHVQARDPDGDALLLTAPTLPPGAAFTDLGGGLGRIDWTPTAAQIGLHPVETVADDGALTADLAFTVTVVDNRPPVLDLFPVDPRICVQGPWWPGTLTLRASAHDPDGTDVSYQWTFHDDGTVQNGSDVEHDYTVPGQELVTLTVTDGHGVQTSTTITVWVDDCVHVEAEIDDWCIAPLFSQASGRVTLYDHTGTPTTGGYHVRVVYEDPFGRKEAHSITGTIGGANTTFDLPHDLAPLPINHLWLHDVYVTGFKDDTLFGDTEWDSQRRFYDVSPLCDVPPPLPVR